MFKSSVLATMTMVASANEVEGWNHGPGPIGHGVVGPLRGHGIIGRASSYSASDRLVKRGLVGPGLGYGGVGVAGHGLGYGGVGVAGRGVLLARTDSYSPSDKLIRRGLVGHGLGYGGVGVAG